MPSGQLQSGNLFISIVGGVYDAFSLGFNLDVVGVSWGPSTSARRNREGMFDLVMTPTRWNFLKGDTRDEGSLNSEFFAQWKFSDRYLARIGWSHYFAEWKAQSTLEGAATLGTERHGVFLRLELSRIVQPTSGQQIDIQFM